RIAAPLVGVDRGARLDCLGDVVLERVAFGVWDDLGVDLPGAAFAHPEHNGLVDRATAFAHALALTDALVHVLGLPSDECLVNLDLAGEDHALGLHSEPDTVQHEPG